MPVSIRARQDTDFGVLTKVLERTAVDGYPPHRPGGLQSFVQASNELAAFVYVIDDVVVGHVAVHEFSARTVMAAAVKATGKRADALAAIARLFVDPRARRAGIATVLLRAATEASWEMRRHPVVDVWEGLPGAVALYESAGWKHEATIDIRFRSPCTPACVHEGDFIRSRVYVAHEA